MWLFNNALQTLPEAICDLSIDWNGIDFWNFPYFAIGGNELCFEDEVPDCILNSEHFDESLDQFYYSFTVIHEQDCPEASGDANLDGELNVLDVVIMTNFILETDFPSETQFAVGDLNVDGIVNVLDVINLLNLILD